MTKVSSITIDSSCFSNNTFINSVDCGNAKWTSNSMSNAFKNCTALTSISQINSSITNLDNAFEGCSLLSGDIRIDSENVSSASDCFKSTSLRKNVFIPYNSTTYETLTSIGYDENGTKDGVYLINKNAPFYTLTINPTPSDAVVVLTASGFTQVGNTINVRENTLVEYSVSKEGYTTQSGSKTMTADMSLNIILEEAPLVSFEATAYNSTVAGYGIGDSIYVNEGMAGSHDYVAYPCEDQYKVASTIEAVITSKNVVNGETVFGFEGEVTEIELYVTSDDNATITVIDGHNVNAKVTSDDGATITTSTQLENGNIGSEYAEFDIKCNVELQESDCILVVDGIRYALADLPLVCKKSSGYGIKINKSGYKPLQLVGKRGYQTIVNITLEEEGE